MMQYNKHWAKCQDCKVKYPYWVMQYDHLGAKIHMLSRSGKFGRNTMLAEMAKCEIVCANCHADRTNSRLSDGSSPS